jgi:hypothetical protein
MTLSSAGKKLIWVALFGAAFAFVESSVVVYLRAIYYPGGFSFPLRLISPQHLWVELIREAATLVMIAVVAIIAGSRSWERFAFFLVAFGMWDIFYYVWLKVVLGWPMGFSDWDILFLIPVPWIGPVIAPVLISLLMIVFGVVIVLRIESNSWFHPTLVSWVLSIGGSVIILYSFMMDTGATLHGDVPLPYQYGYLATGLVCFLVSFGVACRPSSRHLVSRDV